MADEILTDAEASGIYQIRNLVNGKRYIGSAVRISKRWQEHRRDLCRQAHHSRALQRAWTKYGEGSFAFEVIENCDPGELLAREQGHLDTRAEYNICRTAGSSLGIKHSPETIAKMKVAQAEVRARPGWVSPTKGRKYSREICERMAAPKRGRKLPPRSPEWCHRLSESKKGNRFSVGREVSQQTRDKIAQSLTGRKKPIAARISDRRLTLTDDQVRHIRALRNEGLGYAEISAQAGVGRQLAVRVCLKQRYEWVDPHIEVKQFRRTGWKVVGRKRGVRRNG